MIIKIKDKQAVSELAAEIAQKTKIGDIIGLKGTLGAGKSFFAKEFINPLSLEPQDVLSPTFNSVYSYNTKKGEIFHFDLYRLKSEQELENIGFFDCLDNSIIIVEWPEIAENFLKKNYIEIIITTTNNNEEREVIINGKI